MPWETATNDWMMAENLSNNAPPQRESPPKKGYHPLSKWFCQPIQDDSIRTHPGRLNHWMIDVVDVKIAAVLLFPRPKFNRGNLKITRLLNGTNHRTQHIHEFGFQLLVLRHSWRSRLPEALNDGIWYIQRHDGLFFWANRSQRREKDRVR